MEWLGERHRFDVDYDDILQKSYQCHCCTGYTPYDVTHASDNFQKLYDLAVDLIRR